MLNLPHTILQLTFEESKNNDKTKINKKILFSANSKFHILSDFTCVLPKNKLTWIKAEERVTLVEKFKSSNDKKKMFVIFLNEPKWKWFSSFSFSGQMTSSICFSITILDPFLSTWILNELRDGCSFCVNIQSLVAFSDDDRGWKITRCTC
jgi:hypothetical protein